MEPVVLVSVVVAVAAAIAFAVRERRSADRSRHAAELLRRSTEDLQGRVRSLDEDRSTMENVLSSMEEGVVLVGPTVACRGWWEYPSGRMAAALSPGAAGVPIGIRDVVAKLQHRPARSPSVHL